jgi:ubiquinone/menaquinone biosynthesis C-methylase UbiE
MDLFSHPDIVSGYLERLDATTLPFTVDAACLIKLVPPRYGEKYVVLDDACGTGAAVEWIVQQFLVSGVDLEIDVMDNSAVMMNEVSKRRERLGWGDNVKTFLMDAQVLLAIVKTD